MTGARVAVTNVGEGARRTVHALRAVGLEPVMLPCIEARPVSEGELSEARTAIASSDLAVFTSPRALEVLWPDGGLPPVEIAAVGPSTAEAVRRAGGEATVVGAGTGDDLVSLLCASVTGQQVVLATSASADPIRADRLRAAGGEVTTVTVYHTVSVAPRPDPVDAVLFGSPSAVGGWLLSRALPTSLVVGAIGPTTTAELVRQGRPPDVVPHRLASPALVEALAAHLERVA
ncbi:uroporphyrinogen-III synthase [soil metagenome]